MNPVFKFLPGDIDAGQTSIIMEVSEESFSYFFINDKNKLISGFCIFHFDTKDAETGTAAILNNILNEQPLLKKQYNRIVVSYSFNESILTPSQYYSADENSENLNLVYGDLQKGIILTDHVLEKDLYNIYRIPSNIHSAFVSQFSTATFVHQYSILIKKLPDSGNELNVIFYPNKIVAVLSKGGRLQIAQTFKFKTPEDSVYHMLNVCHQFEATQVNVQLSGMIEEDSIMFKEVSKYFLTTFTGLPPEFEYLEEIKKIPSHYFSHLFSIALCV